MRDEIFKLTEKSQQLLRMKGGAKISLQAFDILMALQNAGCGWRDLLPAASAYPVAMLELSSNGILARVERELGGHHA